MTNLTWPRVVARAVFLGLVTIQSASQASAAERSGEDSAASAFSTVACQRYLGVTRKPSPVVQAKARELLLWFTLSHPAWERALQAADSEDTKIDLIHLPLAYSVAPPPAKLWRRKSRIHRRIKKVAYYVHPSDLDIRFYAEFRDQVGAHAEKTRKFLTNQGDQAADLQDRTRCVAALLLKSLSLMDVFTNDRWWWGQGEYTHPKIKVTVPEMGWPPFQSITMDWARSFSIEDLKAMRRFIEYAQDEEVAAVVFNFMVTHIKSIVVRQQDLLLALDAGQEPPRAGELIDRIVAVTNGSADAALLASPVTALAAPSLPPGRTVEFDATEINQFLADTAERVAGPLEHQNFQDSWRRHQRVTELITALLDQSRSADTPPSLWGAWSRSADGNPQWILTFTRHLVELSRRTHEDARRVDAALTAMEQLQAWFDAEVQFVEKLDKSEAALTRLTPHQQEVMNAALSMMNALGGLLGSSTSALEVRRLATRKALETISTLTLLSAQVAQANLIGKDQHAAERPLRQFLDELAAASD